MNAEMDDDNVIQLGSSTNSKRSLGQRSLPYYSSSQQQLYQEYQHQQYQYEHQRQSPSTIGRFLIWLLDVCTGPNFGILVAVLVVLLLQFKSTFVDLYCNAIEDGLYQTLLGIFYGFQDFTRAYYQMMCELFQSIRVFSTTGTRAGNSQQQTRMRSHPGSSPPPLVTVEDIHEGSIVSSVGATFGQTNIPNASTTANIQIRNLLAPGLTQSHAKGTLDGSSIAMPINEAHSGRRRRQHRAFLSERPSSPSISSSASPVPNAPHEEIEPAFLNETDYPPGWLVYHPILGVVPKEEADKYEKSHSSSSTAAPTPPLELSQPTSPTLVSTKYDSRHPSIKKATTAGTVLSASIAPSG